MSDKAESPDSADRDDSADQEQKDAAPEYVPPISAQPPKVVKQEDNHVEVSASPAFQCLDELFTAGKLSGTKVSLLKAKYTELHETLKSSRENEAMLISNAKNFTNILEKQRSELEKGDNFPESYNTEVSKLREQFLKHTNELAEAEERQYQLAYKIECLTEEKKLVEKEYARMPNQSKIEKEVRELHASCEEMKKEIAQRQNEAKNLREDLDGSLRQVTIENKEYEALTSSIEQLKNELSQLNIIPGQIAKEADKIARKRNDLENQLKQLNNNLEGLQDEAKHHEEKFSHLDEEKFMMDSELDRQRSKLNDSEREFSVLLKKYEMEKDREASLMADRAGVDLNLRHINLEKKNQHDILSRKNREKDRDMRNLKKAELLLKVAEETLNHTKSVYDKIQSQVDSMPRDDGTLAKKKADLQREVEQAKRALKQQHSLTSVEHVKLEASAADEQNLLYQQSDLRIEVVELTRLAAIKADEREQKARDFMRAEMRFHRAVEDLKTKQLQITDHQKKYHEMQIKLKEFAKLYDVIKNERNKCVNLIQTSTQKAAEMKEKIKILQNEIEILRTAVMQKDKQLQKHRLRHRTSIELRDSLRKEVGKQQTIEESMREKRDQQKMDIAKLNMMINQAEEQMVKLRKRYEEAVKHRNNRGIKLIERNEEVCIFYEKVNIQDQMIRNGEVELKAREEEIRFIKLQLTEENRNMELNRKALPNKKALENELVTMQIQLQQCQDRMLELEKDLENPYDETRVRYLEGKDPTPAEILTKVEELEMRLAEKEEHLLEKDLIFEQVQRLADRIRHKAEVGKEDTLELAKKVNEVQSRIKETTRKMMAIVSELSMNQANAMKLQQELKSQESMLEQCYIRMEKGEPPSEEIFRDWLRYCRDEERKSFEQDEQRAVEEDEEHYKLPGGFVTTAEPRPNAYIPDDDTELPIPRPYGSHAPYKPSEPGSTMRHIRKPIPKPIEI
ncbi:coiled-coil domain-containing protein 146-like [Gigantopelta aegis]|uniref:coiled-coil domain-containing protein 146-like n=1 Tax=Gigantopelta aegis TaxID=1735272 RepID=UPI001B88B9BC|nr:coiled-coil domain-containing protein 146-like [Gigantopelta aegis]XP_041349850.1 coiled-coil domain-containing protein 146-like [Gigantopelta aegis]